MFKMPEKFRIHLDGYPPGDETCGAFIVPLKHSQMVRVIASAAMGWEHVSVSRKDRCPTWDEMCQIKDLFWDDSDCVVQFHPPKAEYVNNHPNCLHLWRPIGWDIRTPERVMV